MKREFKEAIEDSESPVIDVNANGDEVLSILIQEDGMPAPEMVDGKTENVLLYIHGMYDFVYGDESAIVCTDPYICVEPTSRESTYRVTVADRSVESMPQQSDDILRGLKQAIEDNDLDLLLDTYEEIIDSQVRRDVINSLLGRLSNIPPERITVNEQGWLIDNYYLVDWTASVYTRENNDTENYRRGGGGVTAYDKSFEFVDLTLSGSESPDRAKVNVDGEMKVLGEREMVFLSKVRWLIKRHEYHKDKPFWLWQEKRRQKFLSDET